MTVFGLKSGQDLGNRAAHPHQEFPGVPPGSSIFKDMNTESTNINNKGLQRTANECAVERRIYEDSCGSAKMNTEHGPPVHGPLPGSGPWTTPVDFL